MAATQYTRMLPRDILPGMTVKMNVPRGRTDVPNDEDCEVVAVKKTKRDGRTTYAITISYAGEFAWSEPKKTTRHFSPRDTVEVKGPLCDACKIRPYETHYDNVPFCAECLSDIQGVIEDERGI